MSTLEPRPNPSEEADPPSWESYLLQLGAQFQVKITEPDAILRLSALATQSQLAIGTHDSYVVVSYGEPSEEGMTPKAEVVFDIGEGGNLVASEILYTDEVWGDFQQHLAESNLPPTDEQSFGGDRFAAYLLGKVAQENWAAEDHGQGTTKR
jgi:hypothetical protein